MWPQNSINYIYNRLRQECAVLFAANIIMWVIFGQVREMAKRRGHLMKQTPSQMGCNSLPYGYTFSRPHKIQIKGLVPSDNLNSKIYDSILT